jgi:hypothetical protein
VVIGSEQGNGILNSTNNLIYGLGDPLSCNFAGNCYTNANPAPGNGSEPGLTCIVNSNCTSQPNPLFVSISTPDFHLQATSPAIGAGTAPPSSLAYDIEGKARPSSTPAIGAFEIAGSPTQLTTVTLTSSFNPSVVGQSVTFRATVTSTGGTPTGIVTFFDGTASLGTAALNASGVTTFTTFSLAVGFDSITAQYAGDTTFATSTSEAYTQVAVLSFLSSSCSLLSIYMFGPACQSHPIPAPPFSVPSFILAAWSNLAYRSDMESLLGLF